MASTSQASETVTNAQQTSATAPIHRLAFSPIDNEFIALLTYKAVIVVPRDTLLSTNDAQGCLSRVFICSHSETVRDAKFAVSASLKAASDSLFISTVADDKKLRIWRLVRNNDSQEGPQEGVCVYTKFAGFLRCIISLG